MGNILRKQNRMMNCPAVTAGQIPYRNVTVKDKLDELDNRASANTLGTAVDISAYTSSSNPYTCPSDGLLYVSTATSTANTQCVIAEASTNIPIIAARPNGQLGAVVSQYAKKGMQVYVLSNSANASVRFYPLEGSALPSAESEGF